MVDGGKTASPAASAWIVHIFSSLTHSFSIQCSSSILMMKNSCTAGSNPCLKPASLPPTSRLPPSFPIFTPTSRFPLPSLWFEVAPHGLERCTAYVLYTHSVRSVSAKSPKREGIRPSSSWRGSSWCHERISSPFFHWWIDGQKRETSAHMPRRRLLPPSVRMVGHRRLDRPDAHRSWG
jgi:hypothetical protein